MPEHTGRAIPDSFHPLVRAWFAERYGEPTPVQAAAWPLIASGAHVLASAPTGSGKTLTAFLDVLSRLASGALPSEGLSVLYVSPLKALNEDVRLNLVSPLRELSAYFSANGAAFPKIRVASRSGDTPQSERRSMVAKPPTILCTTPESLAILLASKSGMANLSTVRLLILDEVHAVLGTKRGSALACAVGRLALLAGEFQRVALSATVRPFETAARFVGGRRLMRAPDGQARYEARNVEIVAPPSPKRYELSVAWPAAPIRVRPPGAGPDDADPDTPTGRYDAIVDDVAERLSRERSTIVFANSRRRAERLASMFNEKAGEGTAWAHHGSLSKEVRKAVETRLKEGRLRCVVATSTLELGIDVGAVDLVVMAGSPSRADQTLQRAGRAGHGVGLASRAIVYPFHGLDLLVAAAAVGAALDGDVDPVRPPDSPLDILSQAILAMVLFDERRIEELFDEVRSFQPFENLDRADFNAVVGLLSGRYAGSRVKELSARVYLDEENGTIRARAGSTMLLYSSGGSIPDRGYYAMRLADGGTKIGELDEEFVFERRVGNSFSFGAQAWRIVSIGDEAVTVAPLDRAADFMPFWKAEKAPRGASVAKRMLEACADYQADPAGFASGLVAARGFSTEAADALSAFLAAQARSQRGAALPSPSTLSIELYRDTSKQGGSASVVVHTLRGAAVNEPLGMALAASLGERVGLRVERLSDDDSILLILPYSDLGEAERAVRAALAELANPVRLLALIRGGLADSGAFGAAFRENAGRALLLPRSGFGKRTPLWVTRLRAKRLFEKTAEYNDFPIVKETWKSVLDGRFDLPATAALCSGLADGVIGLSFFCPTAPSPFSRQSGWAETNRFLYEGDDMPGGSAHATKGGQADGARSAGDEAIAAALMDASARPIIPPSLADGLSRKLRRELPGWAPETPEALADWVDERVAIPIAEWEALLAACPPELASGAMAALAGVSEEGGIMSRLTITRLPGATVDVVLRRERLAALVASPSSFIEEWLRSVGPVSVSSIRTLFGLESDDAVTAALPVAIIVGDLGSMGGQEGTLGACDRDILEALLRMTRKAARPDLESAPASLLPAFIATLQGLGLSSAAETPAATETGPVDDTAIAGLEATRRALRILSGYPAPAALWETEILPARVDGYRPEYLDELLGSGEFVWFGAGPQVVAFTPLEEFQVFECVSDSRLLMSSDTPIDAWAIKDRNGLSLAELEERLWDEAWQGAISADSFEPVRRAAADGWKRMAASASVPESGQRDGKEIRSSTPRRVPLALSRRWKLGAPIAGKWFSLSLVDAPLDEADKLERASMAVRILGRRYGLLCRALLERESPAISWSALFPAMRRLELSGELVSGRFFDGLDGLQFMGRDALSSFSGGGYRRRSWWMNACDPASPAGLAAVGLPSGIPARLAVHRMAMRDDTAVCVSKKSFRELEIAIAPDNPELGKAIVFMVEARRRVVAPERRIQVASINGQAAAGSPYAPALLALGFDADRGALTLW